MRSMSDWVKETEEYSPRPRGLASGLTSVEAGGGGVTLMSPASDEPGLRRGGSSSSLATLAPPCLRSSSALKSVISDSEAGL